MTVSDVIGHLGSAVGAVHVHVDDAVAVAASVDWTGRWTGSPRCVVEAGSAAEVAAVVRICGDHGVAVVPQGGNTGLVGGAAAPLGTVILSTRRLRGVGEVDVDRGRVEAQAGVTIEQLHDQVAGSGWRYPVDFAARSAATVGGTIATNAGGVHVFRHGSTRAAVVGLEWVQADGSIVSRLAGLPKDNTGYDLAALLVGSEGTLGIVTAAALRLVPARAETVTALVGFGSLGDAVAAAWTIRRYDPASEVIELVDGACLDLVATVREASSPVGTPAAALLVESAADHDPAPALAAALDRCAGVLEVAVAASAADRARLWTFRDEVSAVLAALGDVRKFDVSLPADRLVEMCHAAPDLVASNAPGAEAWIFGHVCDGNLHLNVTGAGDRGHALDAAVYGAVAAMGGSISAEHGIGRAKAEWVHLCRSPQERASMRAVKTALDPAGLLNPGVLLG